MILPNAVLLLAVIVLGLIFYIKTYLHGLNHGRNLMFPMHHYPPYHYPPTGGVSNTNASPPSNKNEGDTSNKVVLYAIILGFMVVSGNLIMNHHKAIEGRPIQVKEQEDKRLTERNASFKGLLAAVSLPQEMSEHPPDEIAISFFAKLKSVTDKKVLRHIKEDFVSCKECHLHMIKNNYQYDLYIGSFKSEQSTQLHMELFHPEYYYFETIAT